MGKFLRCKIIYFPMMSNNLHYTKKSCLFKFKDKNDLLDRCYWPEFGLELKMAP